MWAFLSLIVFFPRLFLFASRGNCSQNRSSLSHTHTYTKKTKEADCTDFVLLVPIGNRHFFAELVLAKVGAFAVSRKGRTPYRRRCADVYRFSEGSTAVSLKRTRNNYMLRERQSDSMCCQAKTHLLLSLFIFMNE